MFFLLRMTFWLGLVLVLLPSGSPGQSAPKTRIDASDALSAAGATVRDVKGFCAREPNACAVGEEVATAIGYRAQAGAKMLYQLLRGALPVDGTDPHAADAPISGPGKSAPRPASQTTLTPGDLTPAWRGPPLPQGNKHSA